MKKTDFTWIRKRLVFRLTFSNLTKLTKSLFISTKKKQCNRFSFISRNGGSIKIFLKKCLRVYLQRKKGSFAKYFIVCNASITLHIFLLLSFLSVINQLLSCEGCPINAFLDSFSKHFVRGLVHFSEKFFLFFILASKHLQTLHLHSLKISEILPLYRGIIVVLSK